MSEYEKNVYTNLFEYPTKHIVKLELENEEKDKEIKRLNNIIDKAIEYINERKHLNWYTEGVFVEELLNILGGDEE